MNSPLSVRINMSFRRSSSTCLYFHRAEARTVNHPRIDRRPFITAILPCLFLSLYAFSVTTHTGAIATRCCTYIPARLSARVSTSTPKMNMNFSRRGKLSNGFSVLSPVCFIAGRSVIRETSRFLNARVLGPGRSMDLSLSNGLCLAAAIIVT